MDPEIFRRAVSIVYGEPQSPCEIQGLGWANFPQKLKRNVKLLTLTVL